MRCHRYLLCSVMCATFDGGVGFRNRASRSPGTEDKGSARQEPGFPVQEHAHAQDARMTLSLYNMNRHGNHLSLRARLITRC